MEVVQTALGNSVLNLDGALDVLLIGQLHFTIELLRVIVLLRWSQPLHHHLTLLRAVVLAHFKLRLLVPSLVSATRLLLEWQWLILLAAYSKLIGVGALHVEVGVFIARDVPTIHERRAIRDAVTIGVIVRVR